MAIAGANGVANPDRGRPLCWLLVASDRQMRPLRTPNDVSCSLPIPKRIEYSWFFWRGRFGPGNKPCSSFRKTTLLRWHRHGFRLFWKYTSRSAARKPKIAAEIVALTEEMARDNRLWGAERIRGELLKLGIHVSKRTIQKYMRHVRTTRPHGQTRATFLRTHAEQILRVWGL
jgi:hypothetical protein